jgi:hypothetical protein
MWCGVRCRSPVPIKSSPLAKTKNVFFASDDDSSGDESRSRSGYSVSGARDKDKVDNEGDRSKDGHSDVDRHSDREHSKEHDRSTTSGSGGVEASFHSGSGGSGGDGAAVAAVTESSPGGGMRAGGDLALVKGGSGIMVSHPVMMFPSQRATLTGLPTTPVQSVVRVPGDLNGACAICVCVPLVLLAAAATSFPV